MEKFKNIIYLKLLLLSFLQIQLKAQNNIIPNGDFENSSGDCSGSGTNFNNNVQNWKVSMDGPNATDPQGECIKLGATCVQNLFIPLCGFSTGNAVINNKVIMLRRTPAIQPVTGIRNCNYVRKDHIGVALENNQKFNTWKNFKIRYKLLPILGETNQISILPDCNAEAINTHLRFFLSENGPENWEDNGNVMQEIYNANFQQTNSLQSLPSCNWIIVERNFTSASDNFTTLVILIESGGVLLDDVEVFEDCESNYLIQNKKYLQGSYGYNAVNGLNFRESSGGTLSAGNYVAKPNTPVGNVKVEMYSNVVYTAVNEIKLMPGFEAVYDSYFKAVIAGCSTFVNRIGNTSSNSAAENQEVNSVTGITDQLANEMFYEPKLVPNPGNGIYYIHINNKLMYSVDIYDMRGALIKSQFIYDGERQIDITGYSPGLYTFIIKTDNYSKVMKVIKVD